MNFKNDRLRNDDVFTKADMEEYSDSIALTARVSNIKYVFFFFNSDFDISFSLLAPSQFLEL